MKHKGFITGLVLGATLFGATPAIAAGIIAELSTTPIYVDGELASIEAYMINGHNYVQLRDLGKAVDFDVSWDGERGWAIVESDKPYTDDTAVDTTAPKAVAEMVSEKYLASNDTKTSYQVTVTNQTIAGKLSNGQDPTEENIRAMLEEIIEIYPQGTSWGATYNDGDLHWYEGHTACNSYAYMVRDILYGTDCEPMETLTDLSQVQTGDVVFLNNDSTGAGHWMVVSGVGTNSIGMYIDSMSGNSNAKVYIDATYPYSVALERYPDSVIYRYH